MLLAGGAALAASSVGCVGGSKELSADEKERFKPYILDAVPADVPHKLDINFQDKVHLVGFKADPEVAGPGKEVKLTLYWRCDDTLDEGWKLFTHFIDDEGGGGIGNRDNDGPLREPRGKGQILGPDRWQKGKVYVDELTYPVSPGVKGATFSVLVGIWKEEARLRIVSGPHDGSNRAIAGQVKTGLTPPKPEEKHTSLPSVTVNKLAANDKIVIDGKGDEKAWGAAASTGPFVDVGTGLPNASFPVNGTAKLLWNETSLYALVEWKGPVPYDGFTDAKAQPGDFTAGNQPKLWTKDTIELMIDPDGDGDNADYYEIQINPQNKVFKSHFDTEKQPAGADREKGPFGHEDWDPKMKSAVQMADKKEGFVVELEIPWVGFHKAKNKPPKAGDTWRMNFYAMRHNGGVSWSPILGKGSFHHAPRFGRVIWFDPTAKVEIADAGADAGDAAAAALIDAAISDAGPSRPFRMMLPKSLHRPDQIP